VPTLNSTPTAVSLSGLTTGTWTTFTVSGLPAGTSGVILSFNQATSGGATDISVRKTGSTDTGYAPSPYAVASKCQSVKYVGVNSSGQFDLYVNGTLTNFSCYLVGYFGSEATFFTNANVVATTQPTTFTTYNMASVCPGATALFLIHSGRGVARQHGSSDAWYNAAGNTTNYTLVGCDGSQNFDFTAGTSGGASGSLYCIGYMTSGITWYSAAQTLAAIAANASLQNVPTVGSESSPVGFIYRMGVGQAALTLGGPTLNTTNYNPQMSPNGTSTASYEQLVAAGSPAQILLPSDGTNLQLYELGYFFNTSGGGSGGGSNDFGMLMMGAGG